MASEPKGKMFVPVWIDAGIVKALVSDAGTIPVSESSPLATIQAQLYGDMADTWYKVRVSSGRSLHTYIAGQAGDVEIKQISPADIQPGLNTQIGGAWQKQPLIWGFSDSLWGQISGTSDVAGAFYVYEDAVPAGELWVIETIAVARWTNSPAHARVSIYSDSAWANKCDLATVTNTVYESHSFKGMLKETERLRLAFTGATIGEYCEANYWGYKMDVDL